VVVLATRNATTADLARVPIAGRVVLAARIEPGANADSLRLPKGMVAIDARADEAMSPYSIPLTPDSMARELAKFAGWTGGHLDLENGEFRLIGRSSGPDEPPISRSDLIAAYRAVFIHEAAGEAVFVDMDPGDTYDRYRVTFGGGLEDTHLGEVLFEADVLLKALSTGVDPWTDEEPLVTEMCRVRQKTVFQSAFCDFVRPYVKDHKGLDAVKAGLQTLISRAIEANIVVQLSKSAEESDQRCWEDLFFASPERRREIEQEVKTKGSFSGCAVVCETCGEAQQKQRTLDFVRRINNLTNEERRIVPLARAFRRESERRLFALLAFGSPEIRHFLETAPQPEVQRTIRNLTAMTQMTGALEFEESGTDLDYESVTAGIAVGQLIATDQQFAAAFFALSDVDQVTIAFLASSMQLDSGFAAFVNNLHFHQPLCRATPIPALVRSSEDAYVRFVCQHLAKYPRTYLADLVRKELPDPSLYRTAEEIGAAKRNRIRSQKEVRYWFYPGNEALHVSEGLDTFVFHDTRLRAAAEELGSRTGPSHAGDYAQQPIPGLAENLALINDNYDTLAGVFPTLGELRQVVKLLAFFRWIRYYHPHDFDLSAFSQAVDYGSPTPREYPVHETAIALQNGHMLRSRGGIDFHSPTIVAKAPAETAQLLEAVSIAGADGQFHLDGKPMAASPAWRRSRPTGDGVRAQWKAASAVLETLERGDECEVLVKRGGAVVGAERRRGALQGMTVESREFESGAPLREIRRGGIVTAAWTGRFDKHGLVVERSNAVVQLGTGELDPWLEELTSRTCRALAMGLPLSAFHSAVAAPVRGVSFRPVASGVILSTGIGPRVSITRTSPTSTDCTIARLTLEDPTETQRPETSSEWELERVVEIEPHAPDGILVRVGGESRGGESRDVTLTEWVDFINGAGDPKDLGSIVYGPKSEREARGVFFDTSAVLAGMDGEIDRAFLVDTIARLRTRSLRSRKGLPQTALLVSGRPLPGAVEVIREAHPRVVIADPQGFRPAQWSEVLKLASRLPQGTLLTFDPEHEPENPIPTEVIWLTALNEDETSTRLAAAQDAGWLHAVRRVRLFNVNNPILALRDLIEQSATVSAVGAWPRTVRFEVALAVLERVAVLRSELDGAIQVAIDGIAAEVKRSPSPARLRLSREARALSEGWEEVRGTGTSWTIGPAL